MLHLASLFALSAGGAACVFAQVPQLDAGSDLMLRSRDIRFVLFLSQESTGRTTLSQLAVEKASHGEVRDFSKSAIEECAKVKERLDSIASPLLTTLPVEIPASQLAVQDKIQNLTGPRFDRLYMKSIVKEDAKQIKAFKSELKHGQNPNVKDLASETLPVLQSRLVQAKAIYRDVAAKPAQLSGMKNKP